MPKRFLEAEKFMKWIGIWMIVAALMMAQDKSRTADHSKASDASAGKGSSENKSKSEAKTGDRQHEKQHNDVKTPRDHATGQASGR